MRRYDTRLAVERGQVRSGMSPNRNDYWTAMRYSRDYDPRELHYWRRPSELRGDVRGGAAFTYGFGRDYDVVYGRGRGRNARPPRGYRGGWLGGEPFPGARSARYGRDFRDRSSGGPTWFPRRYGW